MKDPRSSRAFHLHLLNDSRGGLIIQFAIVLAVFLALVAGLKVFNRMTLQPLGCSTGLNTAAQGLSGFQAYHTGGVFDPELVSNDNLAIYQTSMLSAFRSYVPGGNLIAVARHCLMSGVSEIYGAGCPAIASPCQPGVEQTELYLCSPQCSGQLSVPAVSSAEGTEALGTEEGGAEEIPTCFTGETSVLVMGPNGVTEARRMDSITPGTLVLSAPDGIPDSNISHIALTNADIESFKPRPARVLRTIKHPNKPVVLVTLNDGATLKTTWEHLFFVEGQGWVSVKELNHDAKLRDSSGGTRLVKSVTETPERTTVFNFEVAGTRTYFVIPEGASYGIWVHNRKAVPI